MSAVFSAAETSFTSASEDKLYQLKMSGVKNAELALSIIADRPGIISTTLLGNNIANISSSSVVTVIIMNLFGANDYSNPGMEIAISTFISTAFIFLFAEMFPKAISLNSPEKIAIFLAPFFKFIMIIFSPVILFTAFFNKFIFRVAGIDIEKKKNQSTHDEIRDFTKIRHSQGRIVKDESDMVHAILDLNETEIREIMRHRNDLFSIDINSDIKVVTDKLSSSVYSRVPFYEGSKDNIVGVLYIRDFFIRLNKAELGDVSSSDIKGMLHAPIFIPHNTKLMSQLYRFRKTRQHMAFVVDEYGGLMGIATLEDLLEEIVGDIEDEHDGSDDSIVEYQDGTILVAGDYSIRDFNKRFGASLDDKDAATVAGLLIYELERIPSSGEEFVMFGYDIVVKESDANKITYLEMSKNKHN